MVEFHELEKSNSLLSEEKTAKWLFNIIVEHEMQPGEINIVFRSDEGLLELNKEKLNHDTLTDIITDDFVVGDVISGDLHISVDRVIENAEIFEVCPKKEMLRVVAHGVLHLLGYKDKTVENSELMKVAEEKALSLYSALFHVER